MKSPQAVVRSYDAVRWHRTKFRRTRTIACGHFVRRTSVLYFTLVRYFRTIACAVACDRAIACADPEWPGRLPSVWKIIRNVTSRLTCKIGIKTIISNIFMLWTWSTSNKVFPHSLQFICRPWIIHTEPCWSYKAQNIGIGKYIIMTFLRDFISIMNCFFWHRVLSFFLFCNLIHFLSSAQLWSGRYFP
jgi:hypothetical protein